KGQFAVANPDAGRAARVVARDDVHALADQFGHEETILHAADHFLLTLRSLLQIEVTIADSGIAGDPARRVPRSVQSQLAGGVGIQQVVPQDAIFDHHRPPAGDAFIVEWRGAHQAGESAVIDHVDARRRDLLSEFAG